MPIRITLAVALAAVTVPWGAAAASHDCAPTRAANFRPALGAPDVAGDVRVYAIQLKQEIRHVESRESFDLKIRCLMLELVMPTTDADADGRADRPTIVVFNEDAGLATIAAGLRGAPARAVATYGPKDPTNIPGALASFAAVGATHSPAVAYYAAAAPETGPQRLILSAATDGFVRGFMTTFSRIARDFGVYVVSSNNQAEFRETADPIAVAALADPELAPGYATGERTTVYEAIDVTGSDGEGRAGIDVYNNAWMWAPVDAPLGHPARIRYEQLNGAPLSDDDPRRNVISVTRKTPLTTIERSILDLSDDRDMSEANTGPFCLLSEYDPTHAANGCAEARIKIGYGISLPSFMWGSPINTEPPIDVASCSLPTLWMRCLDEREINLFLQPEANPGMWAEYIDLGWDPDAFQALSWLDSAWRAVADSTVRNIRYAVTPHMVGNLVDLTFDGQSVIFERCLPRGDGDTCDGNTPDTFVGVDRFFACEPGETRCDDPVLQPYAGLKRETMVLASWVLDDVPELSIESNRERLAERSRAMQAGTGSPYENDYLETAVWADLDFD